jgi:hypothetical protein
MTTTAIDCCLPPVARRALLRSLAEHVDEFTPADIRRAVATWTPGLPASIREQAWDELVLDVNRLDQLGVGLEWRDVVPGAPPNQGYTIAAEVLEQAITEHLDTLVPAVSA